MYVLDHNIILCVHNRSCHVHVEGQPNYLESVRFLQEQENNNFIITFRCECICDLTQENVH